MIVIRHTDNQLLISVENPLLLTAHILGGWGNHENLNVTVADLFQYGALRIVSDGTTYGIYRNEWTDVTHLGVKFAYKYNKIRGTL